MQFRNARFANVEGSVIDMEVQHAAYGWMPFTANPDDVEPLGKTMFDAAVAAGGVAAYAAPAPVVPDSVSARQFKVQLVVAGIKDQVDAWVAQQTLEVQMAYEYSGSFLRTEPMMQSGFQALGFTDAQIDAFFTAAAAL